MGYTFTPRHVARQRQEEACFQFVRGLVCWGLLATAAFLMWRGSWLAAVGCILLAGVTAVRSSLPYRPPPQAANPSRHRYPLPSRRQ